MIEFRNVTKYYGRTKALNGVDLEVAEGTVCVCIGPSGCGKSTALKLINRLLEPTSGEILVNGKSIQQRSAVRLRREIGYVIQSVGLFPHMTVAQNIGIVPKLFGRDSKWRAQRAEELLELIGLDPDRYLGKYPAQLSGGEAQRIGVARALAANQPILLMDEPFGAVDPLNREILQGEFLSLQKKLRKTIVFVTHDLDEAIRMGDSIAIMNEGRIIQHDTPEHILAQPADRFVSDFVGTDRAIKRLVRFSIDDYMRTDDIPTDSAELSISRKERLTIYHTLRDALSRLLAGDHRSLPVFSSQGEAVGRIFLEDIRRITQEAYR
ncbi:MAG: ABC transporter ATP-binding protein [Spirochaeta sp.]